MPVSEWTPGQQQQISERAYQLFLERGGHHGYHVEDWLRAEAEFGASMPRPKARRAKATS